MGPRMVVALHVLWDYRQNITGRAEKIFKRVVIENETWQDAGELQATACDGF